MEGGELEEETELAQFDEGEGDDDTLSIPPSTKQSNSLFSLFKDVLKLQDSTKVANLDMHELGSLDISVRGCKRISLIANTLGSKNLAGSQEQLISTFFNVEAEINNVTSMAKKGWFAELFVSQKKFSTAQRALSQEFTQFQQPQKRKWFQKKEQIPQRD
jgi:hypothetical protein